MRPFRFVATILLGSLLLAGAAAAHEGHDHGAPPPPVTNTIAPRIDASSNDFEIVAIARGDRLRLYLDTFRTNEPVKDAQVEIDTAAGKAPTKWRLPGCSAPAPTIWPSPFRRPASSTF